MPTDSSRKPRALSGSDAASSHKEIVRQSVDMWARFAATGRQAMPAEYPLVCELYWAAEATYRGDPNAHKKSGFSFMGRRYEWQTTNMGRLKVLDPESGMLLIQGGPFAVW